MGFYTTALLLTCEYNYKFPEQPDIVSATHTASTLTATKIVPVEGTSNHFKLPVVFLFSSKDKFEEYRASGFASLLNDFAITARSNVYGKNFTFLKTSAHIEEDPNQYPNLKQHLIVFDEF